MDILINPEIKEISIFFDIQVIVNTETILTENSYCKVDIPLEYIM